MTLSRYPTDQLFEEVAFVAYHFNWSHREILALPHWERRRWCAEISRINDQITAASGAEGAGVGIDLRTLAATERGQRAGSTAGPGSTATQGRQAGSGDGV